MKKLLSLVLALAMALSITACGGETTPDTPAPDGSGEPVQAEAWRPSGSVDLIVASSAGGAMDSAARLFAKLAEDICGVKMNVVNNTNGGGTVAMVEVMNGRNDGTVLGHFGTALVTDQFNIDNCPYNADTYRYVGIHTSEAAYLSVSTTGPFADMDFDQFIQYAKDHPGEVRIAISGTWNSYDCTRHMMEIEKDVEFKRVSIKGGNNCILSTIAGDVDATLTQFVEVLPQVQAGAVKILAMTGDERNEQAPDAVTMTEAGIDYAAAAPKVLVLPKDTPDEVYEGWVEIFNEVMSAPGTQEQFETLGLTFTPMAGEEAYQFVSDYGATTKEKFVDTGVFDIPLG